MVALEAEVSAAWVVCMHDVFASRSGSAAHHIQYTAPMSRFTALLRNLKSSALSMLIVLSACSTTSAEGSAKMPPGDWVGRCKPSDLAAAPGRPTAPAKWVDDQANILSPGFEAELQRLLTTYHVETCHQVSVAVVGSLHGRKIEDDSLAHANALGLGYRGFNNGLMLFIAPNERGARIEVGCGLEDVVSDAQAAEVMGRDLIPAFRTGDFEGGIRAGVSALAALARRKAVPAAFRPAACAVR